MLHNEAPESGCKTIHLFWYNYIAITEYIHYKTYNLQHNVETLTLLNSGFKTILTKYYFTLPTYSTPLTALEIPYLQNLA